MAADQADAFEQYRKPTRRDTILATMQAIVPWQELCSVIEPHYQGPLQLLLGPDRIEGGWWHRSSEDADARPLNVQRDYWLALSPHAGVLWVFRQRLARDQTAWFLHGHFA